MYKISWDPSINGVLLSDSILDTDKISPPRPVFYEELEVLEFSKKFDYQKGTLAPLLWAIDRRYYYKGKLVAEVHGGSIFNDPSVTFTTEDQRLTIEPVDVGLVIERNAEALDSLENEAKDFARDTYEKYRNRVDQFIVAFSGGKDSQVILDIVKSVVPPSEYKVVFTDTGMELPETYQTVKETEDVYRKSYVGLDFIWAQGDKPALELWQRYGPPSRINRWCCSVLKTALFGRKMKEVLETDKQPKLVVFEGVRADESTRRESYNRIGEGVKHVNIVNSRVIFKWNLTEIFLYSLRRQINLNKAYRYGFHRIGCSICPFASDWSEFLIRKLYPDLTKAYVRVIEDMAKAIGISSQEKIDKYIEIGNWKKNAGGKGLVVNDSRLDIITREPVFEAIMSNPRTDLFTWLTIVGGYIVKPIGKEKYEGELKYGNEVFRIEIEVYENKTVFRTFNTTNKVLLISALYKVLNKYTFCESCGTCEVECPTGALVIYPKHSIDAKKCTHCRSCLNFNSKGCLIVDRQAVSEGETKLSLKTSSIDKYSTFGLRDQWLANFFAEMDNWFFNNGGLGSKQVPAMINWLREAGLLEIKEKKTTELARILRDIYYRDQMFVWQIIWINLYFNSTIVKWYVENVRTGKYTKSELHEELKNDYSIFADGTLNNALSALLNTFQESPILGYQLGLGVIEKLGNAIKSVEKKGSNNIKPAAIAYFLYRLAASKDTYEWSVADFYEKGEIGPLQLFGVTDEYFLNCLRAIQERNSSLLRVDLLGGLDNIHLFEEISAEEVLRSLL